MLITGQGHSAIYVPITFTVETVTQHAVTVQMMLSVTMKLVTAPVFVKINGRGNGVTNARMVSTAQHVQKNAAFVLADYAIKKMDIVLQDVLLIIAPLYVKNAWMGFTIVPVLECVVIVRMDRLAIKKRDTVQIAKLTLKIHIAKYVMRDITERFVTLVAGTV